MLYVIGSIIQFNKQNRHHFGPGSINMDQKLNVLDYFKFKKVSVSQLGHSL